MTRLFKRFISLSMAIVIILSLSSTVFATEETDFVVANNEITAVSTSVTPYSVSASDGYGNISGAHSGVSHRAPLSFSFTVRDGGAYLYYGFGGNAIPHIYVYKDGVCVFDLNVGVQTNGQINSVLMSCSRFPNGYWAGGTYTVNVVFGKLNEAYSMDIWASPVLH